MEITGTNGPDTLAGTAGDDVIKGLDGFDSIDGAGGNDVIDGGADGDSIYGGFGNDMIDGGDGSDNISDAAGSDTLRGGAGADLITINRPGGFPSPNETILIDGGLGNDRVSYLNMIGGTTTIDLGDGEDRLLFGPVNSAAVTVTLGAGQDVVTLLRSASFGTTPTITDFVTGDLGDGLDLSEYLASSLSGWNGSNPFGAGGYLRLLQSGADTLLQRDGDGTAGGTLGFATLLTLKNTDAGEFTAINFGGYAPDGSATPAGTIIGTEKSDFLIGTVGDDVISGLGGSDSVDGKSGNDVIDGGGDADNLQGGLGDDLVIGGEGDDTIFDNSGSDILRGGAGNDVITVSHSSNGTTAPVTAIIVDAGTGNDRVEYYAYTRGTGVIDLGDGADRLALGSGPSAVRATLGGDRDNIELSGFPSFGSSPVITDFMSGASGDNVEFTPNFTFNFYNWDRSNPFGAGGYLRLVQAGADTLFQLDNDGAAGNMNRFRTLAIFENTDASSLTADNFSGFAPIFVDAADLATAFVNAPALVSEGDGAFRLGLTLKNVMNVSTTVSMAFLADQSTATVGSDVNVGGFSGTFTFTQSPAGDYRIDLGSITVIDDALIEGEETVAIRVTASGQVFENGTDSTVVLVKLRSDDVLINEVLGTGAGEVLNGTDGETASSVSEARIRCTGTTATIAWTAGAGTTCCSAARGRTASCSSRWRGAKRTSFETSARRTGCLAPLSWRTATMTA